MAMVWSVVAAVGPLFAGEASAQRKTTKTAQQRHIEEALEKRITLDFANTPLSDVAAFLADHCSIVLVVDAAGEDAPSITFRCREMKLSLVLRFMLKRAGLTHRVERSAIYIATPERMAEVAKNEKGLSFDTPQTKEALAKSVSLDFADTPMGDVCDFLGNFAGLNFVLDTQEAPLLTLRVRDIPLRDSLIYIARLIRLRVYAEDNVIAFTDEAPNAR